MKIGLATTDFERQYTNLPLRTLFQKAHDFGYECLQFSFGSATECGYVPDGQYDIPPAIPENMVPLIQSYKKEFGMDIASVNGTFNCAHPNEAVRKEGERRFELLAQAASAMGSPIITLCSGSRFEAHMWRTHPDNHTPAAWADMVQSMKALVRIAEKYKITLAIEPEDSNIISTPERARRLLDELPSPHLKMIMDGANLFHKSEAHVENVLPVLDKAFRFFGDDIVLAHGKDIKEGDGIEFCGPGDGIVDFHHMKGCLENHRFTGAMVVHGVYEESKMASACALMKAIFAATPVSAQR